MQPFLGVVGGFGAPQVEDLLVWGLDELKQPLSDHVDYHFGVVVGHKSSEETDECNGCKCYRWHTDG